MANSEDVKGRLDLLSLLTEELSAGETVVDVRDKTKLRYALYLRKSTDREDKQQKSIADQKSECYERVIIPNGIKITDDDIYEDSKSAKISGNRPSFDRMIKKIKKGEYDGIIAWHYDRLARNMKEAGEIIDLIDEGKIVDLQLATAHFENNPNGKMILGINFVLSKHYSDHLSESVLRGNSNRTKNGTILNNFIHGYKITEERHLEKDDINWEIIRQAFRMRIDDRCSLQQIADYLNMSGYKVHSRKNGHRPYKFSNQDVSKLLRTPLYAGVHTYGREAVRLSDLADYKDFEPIITEEEYLELNGDKLLHDGYSHRLASRYGKNDVSNFLRSFVICKHCGKTMSTGIVGGGRNSFRFRCNTKGCPMRNKGPAGSLLRDYAVEFLKAHNFGTEENYKRYIEDRNRSIADRTEMLEHSKMSLEQRLAKQKQMYENLLPSLNVSKHVTEERLDSIKSTEEVIKEQLDSVKAEIEALKSAPIKLKEFLELYKNTGEILRLTTSMALADEIIKIFFSNITVEVTKESLNAKQKQWSVVDHTLREPFDKLDDNGDNNTWLGWQGSNLRMTGPKPVALPLGDSPTPPYFSTKSHSSQLLSLYAII